jgi:hypothetical protein
VLLGVGPSQSVEYVFGDEGPKRCSKKDVYKYSFFPHTIRDWNQLSDELLDIDSSEEFKSRLTKLYYGG